ncbi:hypothetical protein LTR36_005672 [Oleoguttula mirabilis]|uniref:Structure-specific endonuclease subunit SLX4 n=1 Tax=Oleoguttula mirabilis TaxID=1507867 RepID=A0AAV9JDF2_9PEZI|nr:hypothetical protein LTR36_005672 [Oleoguttula mirabilis]
MASADRALLQSSSPQLPSPSTFIRPPRSGFATAASLWKQQQDGAAGAAVAAGSRPAGEFLAETAGPAAKKTTGKLKRPKKAVAPPPTEGEPTTGEYVGTRPGRKTEKGRPRKRLPKSEAIIINSDEPEHSAYFAPPRAASDLPPADTVPSRVLEAAEKTAPASRRRLSWTPAKNTVTYALPDERPFTADTAISVPSPTPRVPLSELLGNFNYTNNVSTTSPPPDRAPTGEATTKRRRIELTDTSTVSVVARKTVKKMPAATEMQPPKPAKRSKSPRKKPQTITALATAAYQPLKEPDPEQSTVSEFFASRKEDAPPPHIITEQPAAETAKPKKPRKPRAKKVTEDGTATPTTAKKPVRARNTKMKLNEAKYLPPLYSPEKANAQLQHQAFLFGTSSQLATDESPTFIREIQLAIRESELAPASQAAVSPAKKSSAKVPTAPHGTCLSVEQAEKELWCSAARDFKGGLLRDKSGLPSGRGLRKQNEAVDSQPKPVCRPLAASTAVNLAEMPPPPTKPERAEQPRAPSGCDSFIHIEETTKDKPNVAEAPVAATEPDSFIDIEKTSKNPPKMAKTTMAPTKPDSFVNMDEISDSESPATPSPPRRRASAPPSPVQPLPLVIAGISSEQHYQALTALPATGAALKSTDAQWPIVLKHLFPRITAAVKAAPRSTDPSKPPSWHEKILLYDPIVLEDFTAHLNTHRDLRISVQRTKRKAPAKGRKKKDAPGEPAGPEVETVEEELQAWMVQKWCEEMSVCCLWKGGLRGGVRAQY